MKRLLTTRILFLLLFNIGINVFSQALTTSPAIVTMGKVIKIYYDTSKDNNLRGLLNYTGDLYAHTGVILKGSTSWSHVIGSWGNNTTQPKLVKIGTYLYELDITPDIKTFYALATTDTVSKLALVFRSADGSKQTSPDIFIDVFPAGLRALLTLPVQNSMVVELNKKITVRAFGTFDDSISLYINNQFIKSGSTADSITYTFNSSQYGEYWIKTVAWDKPSFAADSFFVYVRKPVVTEDLPAGLIDGINYTGVSSATLVLYAPYKSYAFVMSDFLGWKACDASYMKVTPDGNRYWLEVSGLTPGKEYRFQYLVDSTLIADPYCDKILDPDNDKYITQVNYPGLLSYPKDTTTGILSVLQTSQLDYSWKSTTYQPPQKTRLVIYEMLVRDFVAAHNYKTITDTLNYLKNLGVNAIELMPVTEFEGNSSWGYNISFLFAPDKYYGPKNTLKALIDSCHSRGIAVIMDLVLNHAFGQSPFVQLYLDHYGNNQIIMKLPNPWFNSISPNTSYYWGADFNHESTETQKLVDRVTSYWMTDYHIDGFRFDFSKGFTNTPGDGGAYDASRIAILKRMANKIWSVNSNAYVILEHFTANSEEKELAEYGMLVWGNQNGQYSEAGKGFTSDLSWGTSQARGWNKANLVTYMESHDEQRLMYNALNNGNSSAGYSIKNPATALKRMELNAVFFYTLPGPKMIWQFGELGYDISIDYNGRTGEKPVKWNYMADINRYHLFIINKYLIGLRKNVDAFSTDSYSYSLSGMQKSIHLNSADMSVTILGNFDVAAASIAPGFQQTGKWYEYFTDDSVIVSGVNDLITLQAGEYRLYSTKRMSSPKNALGINDLFSGKSYHFVNVYPNPSVSEFNFEITGAHPSGIAVSIYDISGRLIARMNEGMSSAEKQLVVWDGKSDSGTEADKGIYFAHIKTGIKTEVVRIIKY